MLHVKEICDLSDDKKNEFARNLTKYLNDLIMKSDAIRNEFEEAMEKTEFIPAREFIMCGCSCMQQELLDLMGTMLEVSDSLGLGEPVDEDKYPKLNEAFDECETTFVSNMDMRKYRK